MGGRARLQVRAAWRGLCTSFNALACMPKHRARALGDEAPCQPRGALRISAASAVPPHARPHRRPGPRGDAARGARDRRGAAREAQYGAQFNRRPALATILHGARDAAAANAVALCGCLKRGLWRPCANDDRRLRVRLQLALHAHPLSKPEGVRPPHTTHARATLEPREVAPALRLPAPHPPSGAPPAGVLRTSHVRRGCGQSLPRRADRTAQRIWPPPLCGSGLQAAPLRTRAYPIRGRHF